MRTRRHQVFTGTQRGNDDLVLTERPAGDVRHRDGFAGSHPREMPCPASEHVGTRRRCSDFVQG